MGCGCCCPSSITVTFSGVDIDCGCSAFSDLGECRCPIPSDCMPAVGQGACCAGAVCLIRSPGSCNPPDFHLGANCCGSDKVSESAMPPFNGTMVTLNKSTCSGTDCFLSGRGPAIKDEIWEDSLCDCVRNSLLDPLRIQINLMSSGGLWYLIAAEGDGGFMIFYATSPNMTGPFVNIVTCNTTNLTPWLFPCPEGNMPLYSDRAHGGIATVV